MSNTNSIKIFPSKLLLFGEYTATLGSDVMAMPFQTFGGHWAMTDNDTDGRLLSLLDALNDGDFKTILNLTDMERDIRAGWIFLSSIPEGYGLGSSGALVAAIYDRYSIMRSPLSLEGLKSTFAKIESIFHGKSSGIDPLVSYLDTCLIIAHNESIQQVGITPKLNKMLLLDTGIPRHTSAFVGIFKEKLGTTDFRKAVEKLTLLNKEAIQCILDANDVLAVVKEISALQFQYFDAMIPASIRHIWKDGLESDSFFLKLCGAGGGGMFYVWTDDKATFTDKYPDLKTLESG